MQTVVRVVLFVLAMIVFVVFMWTGNVLIETAWGRIMGYTFSGPYIQTGIAIAVAWMAVWGWVCRNVKVGK